MHHRTGRSTDARFENAGECIGGLVLVQGVVSEALHWLHPSLLRRRGRKILTWLLSDARIPQGGRLGELRQAGGMKKAEAQCN